MSSSSELEERIRRAEDRFAIHDLAIRFMLAIDAGDYPRLAEMFTEKAVFADAVGGDQIAALLESMRADYGRSLHFPEAQLVEFVDDEHATGVVLAHAEVDIRGRTIQTALRYEDEYERDGDGTWRFAGRDIKVTYALPVTDLAESMTDPLPVRWPGADPAPADGL